MTASALAPTVRFGPFELEISRRRLRCAEKQVWLPERQLDILICLLSHAGNAVEKDTLTAAAWGDRAVADNSLTQAIFGLRKTLGKQANGDEYIVTAFRTGYRFVATVERVRPTREKAALDTLLAPYLAFVDGRAAIESLNIDDIARVRGALEDALRFDPEFGGAHIALAHACFLAYEATRIDATPDRAQLELAHHHAEEGCRLKPLSGDAWSALALVCSRLGRHRDALAAARRAIELEGEDWRHHVRLASVSWGEARLRAAQFALKLCPGCSLAHWFSATVFVARGALERALDELRLAIGARPSQPAAGSKFSAVGLHFLTGLTLAALGRVDDALEELERELATANPSHVYGREAAANTWYAIGALRLRQGETDEARDAFHQALRLVPTHPMTRVALGDVGGLIRLATINGAVPVMTLSPSGSQSVEQTIAMAALLIRNGREAEAVPLCLDAFTQAEPESAAGWLLTVEPLMDVRAHPEAWLPVLTALRDRAM